MLTAAFLTGNRKAQKIFKKFEMDKGRRAI